MSNKPEQIEEKKASYGVNAASADPVETGDPHKNRADKENDDKTADSSSVSTPGQTGKAKMVENIIAKLSRLSKEDLAELHSRVFEDEDEYEDEEDGDEDTQKPVSIDISDDVAELLASQSAGLSEEFKTHAATLFEASVNARVTLERTRLEESYEMALEEAVTGLAEELVDKIDDFLDEAIERWYEDNKIAIDSSIRADIAENLLDGIRSVFEANYVSVPEDKIDLVDDLVTKVADLEDKLNEEIRYGMETKNQLTALKKAAVVEAVSNTLTDVQKEKLVSLAEGVDYTDDATYKEKLGVIRENLFAHPAKKPSETLELDDNANPSLTEDNTQPVKSSDPAVNRIAQYMTESSVFRSKK